MATDAAQPPPLPPPLPPEPPAPDARGRLTVRCSCGKTLLVPRYLAGRSAPCPGCHRPLAVPVPAAPTGSPAPVEPAEPVDPLVNQVRIAMERNAAGAKRSWTKNLGTLLLSVLLFVSFGLFDNSVSGIAVLVLTIFIHESGHWVGMKIFRYQNVHMFFIPFFGAAVSGAESNPSGAKEALVSLLGPIPGIVLGIGAAFAYRQTHAPILIDATRTLLFLNVFNLLPFHPLDGGLFFDTVLFSRHPRVEIVFKVLTTLALGLIALAARSVMLGVFTFVILLSLRSAYLAGTVARALRGELAGDPTAADAEAPGPHLAAIVARLKQKIPKAQWQPGLFATYAEGIWRRVRTRPCPVGAAIAMIVGYLACFLIGFSAWAVFEYKVSIAPRRGAQAAEQPVAGPEPAAP